MSDETRLASLRNEVEYLKTTGRKEALVSVEFLEWLLLRGEATLRVAKLQETWRTRPGNGKIDAEVYADEVLAALHGTGH